MRCHRLPILAYAAAVGAFALVAAGCGGSPGNNVAQLGSTTSGAGSSGTSPAPGGSTTSAGSTSATMLAYARCMRSHGVPSFPDPAGGGQIPKAQVVAARHDDPSRFDSAQSACRHLLPNGGNGETQAQIAQDWNRFLAFARCMRSHGVERWPDPSSRSATDRRPDFDLQAAGLDPNSAKLRSKAQQCASTLHMSGLPPAH